MARRDFLRSCASFRRLIVALFLVIGPSSVAYANFEFVGAVSYVVAAPKVTLSARIRSFPPHVGDQFTNFVRLELWAFPAPSTGSLTGGVKVGQYFVGNMFFTDERPVNQEVAFTQPADGTWYFTMFITEAVDGATTNGGYVVRAFHNFATPVVYGVPLPSDQALAVEYFHSGFGHYFVTAQSDEIGGLDSGVFAGWARTGQTFKVWTEGAGLADLCRFFTTFFAPKSSHFYTASASECELVKHNPVWQYEKIAAKVGLPVNGVCATGIPLYRLYNDGQTGAPNHRYTTSASIRTTLIAQGFLPEDDNTVCVPQ